MYYFNFLNIYLQVSTETKFSQCIHLQIQPPSKFHNLSKKVSNFCHMQFQKYDLFQSLANFWWEFGKKKSFQAISQINWLHCGMAGWQCNLITIKSKSILEMRANSSWEIEAFVLCFHNVNADLKIRGN